MYRPMIPALFKQNRLAACDELADARAQDMREGTPAIRVTDIENVDERLLHLLAWQYRVDFWRDDLGEDVKRDLIRGSFAWHRKKGTLWAVTHLLKTVGLSDARVIEFAAARNRWSDAGGARLDGSWGLDGSTDLVPWASLAGMPYLPGWAYFAVSLNIAEGYRPGWPDDARRVIDLAKPARSWPLYFMNVLFDVSAGPKFYHVLKLTKDVAQRYPWCTNQLDGMWILGNGGDRRRLDGSFLDGGWAVGGSYPVWSMATLRQCSILSSATWTGGYERPGRYVLASLGDSRLHLGRGWQVGKNRVFACSDALSVISPALGCGPAMHVCSASSVVQRYPWPIRSLAALPRLDGCPLGAWRVGGSSLSLDGLWRISVAGVKARGRGVDTIFAEGGIPERLGRRLLVSEGGPVGLNGSWRVGRNGVRACQNVVASLSSRLDCAPEVGRGEKSGVAASSSVVQRYPRPVRSLAAMPTLDGSPLGAWRVGGALLSLDGLWRVSVAGVKAQGCGVDTIFAEAGIPERLGRYPRLGDGRCRELSGWRVGAKYRLDGSWALSASIMLVSPALGIVFRKVDRSWRLGDSGHPIDGSWRLGRVGMPRMV